MKVNFTTKLKDLKGEQIIENYQNAEGKMEKREVTLADVALASLTAAVPAEAGVVEKMLRYKIAKKVTSAKDVDLTIDETKKIRDCIGESMPITYVGACFDLLGE